MNNERKWYYIEVLPRNDIHWIRVGKIQSYGLAYLIMEFLKKHYDDCRMV